MRTPAPPFLNSRRARLLLAPILFGSLVALVVLVRWAVLWTLPLPVCGLRILTGLPCPFCGTTRVLLELSHLDLVAAFHFNPLVFLACTALGAWFALWIVDRLFQRAWQITLLRRINRLPLVRLLTLAGLVNWVYLCFNLPR
jgi:hypothetical protein